MACGCGHATPLIYRDGVSNGASSSSRRLGQHYSAWLGQTEEQIAAALRSATIVVDANVLLSLYEVGISARQEILEVLQQASERLWIPHQVAIEFSRNRERVVVDRVSRFKRAKMNTTQAIRKAVDSLEGAVNDVVSIRERNRTVRTWNADSLDVSRASFESRLEGVLDPALDELAALEAEHDLGPGDVRRNDPILNRLDKIFFGKIGNPITSQILRMLVDEAVNFRYPNQIPPGDQDADKRTDVHAAGDYILWWQMLAHLRESSIGRVLLVTSDAKSDWWKFDAKERPVGPRPELVQEMADEAQAELVLLSLSAFLENSKEFFRVVVSDDTVEQVRGVEESLGNRQSSVDAPDGLGLGELSPRQLESLVAKLLPRLGYEDIDRSDRRFDFVATSPQSFGVGREAIEVKSYRRGLAAHTVREFIGGLVDANLSQGVLITSGPVAASARAVAERSRIPVDLVDGHKLQGLLERHLGSGFMADYIDPEGNEDAID